MISKYLRSFVAIFFKIVSALITNKLFAIYFGESGIALLAHLQNLFGISTIISTEGIQRGMTKYLSDEKLDVKEKKEILLASLLLTIFVFICFCLILYFFNDFFLGIIDTNGYPFTFSLILCSSLLCYLLYLFGLTLILIRQELNQYLFAGFFSSVILVVGISISATMYNLKLNLLTFAILQALPLIIILALFFVSMKEHPAWLKGQFKLSLDAINLIGKYALMALSILIFSQLLEYLIRQFAINKFGLNAVGLWQAMVKISKSSQQIFVAVVGIVFFPKLSAIIKDKQKTIIFIRETFTLWVPILLIALVCFYFCRNFVLTLLFSKMFIKAGEFAIPQLIGDFFYLLGHFFAYWLLADAKLYIYTILQIVSAFIYLIAIFFLLPYFGIITFPIAYAIDTFACALILFVIWYKKMIFEY